jgi:serine/threonine protein kinase
MLTPNSKTLLLNSRAGHKNIAGVKDMYEDEKNIYIVMELCEGGSLFDTISSQSYQVLENDVFHDDTLVYTISGPPHWLVSCFIDYNLPLIIRARFLGLLVRPRTFNDQL